MTKRQAHLFYGAAFCVMFFWFGAMAWATWRVGEYGTAIFAASLGSILGLAGINEVGKLFETDQ